VVPDRVTIIGQDRVIDEPYRRRMNYSNIQKVLGCSSTEVDSELNEFFSRDISQPKSFEIFEMLDNLLGRI
jgi:hypothetical protein